MGSAGVDVSALRDSAGEKLFFDSWESIENMFAGRAAASLKEAGSRLGVLFTARDTWIKVSSPDGSARDRALNFLRSLAELQSLRGGPLEPGDVEQALKESETGSESALKVFFSERINVSPRKRPVAPRTRNQLAYLRAMRKQDVVFGLGPAGTGKTYLAVAEAVEMLLSGKCERIVLTRPAVEAGENLGFLPGKLEEKINPFLRPLFDALYDMMTPDEINMLTEKGILEIAPLAFMRGRTLNHSFIILDEAQNTTGEQMLMFLTRLGSGSRCIVCGDPTQVDLARRSDSGLLRAVQRLQGIEGIGVCRFSAGDVVRHPLVEKIIHAYEDDTHGNAGKGDLT